MLSAHRTFREWTLSILILTHQDGILRRVITITTFIIIAVNPSVILRLALLHSPGPYETPASSCAGLCPRP